MAVGDVTTLQQSLSTTSFFDSVKIVVTIKHQALSLCNSCLNHLPNLNSSLQLHGRMVDSQYQCE